MTGEKLGKIIHSAEQIITELNDPGINTFHLFIALGRAAQ
jgi:hypothetical protein